MTRFYRAPNKRLIARGAGGRFRQTTLSDVGLSTCKDCGKIFAPDFAEIDGRQGGGFIDPRDFNRVRERCKACREKEVSHA